MELLIVRHAEAAQGEPDELRPLTPTGRDQSRALADRLRADGLRPDAILTSPLLRARETGELLGKALGLEPVADERLSPGAAAAEVAEAAAEHGDTVVLVGHQPDCSRIVAALGGGPEPDFPPAGSVPVSL
jgi:phosphohistidine phosphatase